MQKPKIEVKIPEIATQKVKISANPKTCDMYQADYYLIFSEGNDFVAVITVCSHTGMAGHIVEKGQSLVPGRLKGSQFS
jgi:hypothetical protein